MRVLGIDPGSLTTGYGIVLRGEAGRLIHVCDGAISLPGSLTVPERLLRITESLKAIIEEFRPEAVSIESVFFAKNVSSAITLGQARGAALVSAASFRLPVYEYSPSTIKLAVTGSGSAAKEQVKKMVKLLLNAQTSKKADASDALAIAICHIHHSRPARAASKASGAR